MRLEPDKWIINVIKDYVTEIIIFLIVPTVVVSVFFLPQNIKNSLKSDLLKFNMINFYTSVFTHGNFIHLISNLTSYYIYTSLSYCLSRLSNKKTWFLKCYLIFFLILPLINNFSLIILNKYYLGGKLPPSCGLSGIISAILGLTPISLFVFLKKSGAQLNLEKFMLLIICSSVLLISYSYKHIFLLLITVAILLVSIIVGRKELKSIYRLIKEMPLQDISSYFLAIITISLYFVGVIAIFPNTIIVNGNVVDIISHYLGWTMGLFIPDLLLKIVK